MADFYMVKNPWLLRTILPVALWRKKTSMRELYLTFDDGPIPEVTPWVLDQLKAFGGKATFFCVGDNVRKHPEIYQRILAEGHSVGNHTQHHMQGWATEWNAYLEDIKHCAQYVQSKLFRPPYGKISPRQSRKVSKDYQIVMWDVLSADYHSEVSPETCYRNVVDHARKGSIVVFHDSIKAWKNLQYALPKVLEHYRSWEYQFKAL